MGKAGSLILGVILGVLALGAARFAALPEPDHGVHYHANWAIFINGARLELSGDRYMEDVFACSVDPSMQRPEDRVHMHEGNADVVHVHASGVTWGHMLANIGFGVSDDRLELDSGATYADMDDRSLKFILNGSRVSTIRNRPIDDQDRLLISYGPESVEGVVATQFPRVAENAAEYNVMPDPASCAGGAEEETFTDRMRRAFWF